MGKRSKRGQCRSNERCVMQDGRSLLVMDLLEILGSLWTTWLSDPKETVDTTTLCGASLTRAALSMLSNKAVSLKDYNLKGLQLRSACRQASR